MMTKLLEHPTGSEALSYSQWRPREDWPLAAQGFSLPVNLASMNVRTSIPFGRHTLVFEQPIPAWAHPSLRRIGELGQLGYDWDSYGAMPVDPACAAAAARLVLELLGPTTPKPSIVPTTRGGIQLEWHRANADLEIEVRSPTRLHVYFEDGRTGEEQEIDLSDNLRPLLPLLNRLMQED